MGAYAVGIDLGTTNSVLAYTENHKLEIRTFSVPQHIEPSAVAGHEQLPSSIYLPATGEFAPGAAELPWSRDEDFFVGHFAVKHGAKVPGRTVSSAKSWLSYAGVDRTAPILPWGAAEDVKKLSPVAASALILEHMKKAWNHAHPSHPIEIQDLILTVPASFDDVARNLTLQAAKRAGLENVRLVEEPQAAFYDYLSHNPEVLSEDLKSAHLILVVDVGGGTTDLTLLVVGPGEKAKPSLERIAVGDHLMLGGDNMDVTLARFAEKRMTGEHGGLDGAQWSALAQSARLAKESFLGQSPSDEYRLVLPGRGRRLLGGGLSATIQKNEALELLLDGFFPLSRPDEVPLRRTRMALAEFGLPYADDPAISRHICGFLRQHAEDARAAGAKVEEGLPRPDFVLLNGGVFNSHAIRRRLDSVFENWFGASVPALEHRSLDLAVARGAAYYAMVRRGMGTRIGGGSPRSYFVGVETTKGNKALCVAPKGQLEGTTYELDKTFRLRLNQPVSFPLYTSTHPAEGATEVSNLDELITLPPLQTVLQMDPEVPVRLKAQLTEVGTLELSLHMTIDALQKWGLTFSTRAQEDAAVDKRDEGPPKDDEKLLELAKEAINKYYGKAKGVAPGGVKSLRKQLEKAAGPMDGWSLALNRGLCDELISLEKNRRRTLDHERVFFQIAGFCVRPGFGDPLDEWRIEQLWRLHDPGIHFVKEKATWAAWWIMWRRAAGGLRAEQQLELFDRMWMWLDPKYSGKKKKPRPFGEDEMIRLIAALERVPADKKVEVGRWLTSKLELHDFHSWLPLGRLGARQPFAGSAHEVVHPDEAEQWLKKLKEQDWRTAEGAGLAAVLIARRTGDRERDIPEYLRDSIVKKLEQVKASPNWIRMVHDVTSISDQDRNLMLGDSLPAGLIL